MTLAGSDQNAAAPDPRAARAPEALLIDHRDDVVVALAAICEGGGMANAAIIERLD